MRFNIIVIAIFTLILSSTIHAAPLPPSKSRGGQEQFQYSNPHVDYKSPTDRSPSELNSLPNTSLMAKTAAVCDVNAFATSNSSTLINEIKTQGSGCVNDLFSASSSVLSSAFSSNNMVAVANHTAGLSTSYGGNGDPDLEALFLFIRAGYFAEYYNTTINFDSSVKPATKSAIDAFVNNSYFYANNDLHGEVLQEVLITMDSSEQQDVYLYVVKEWLNRWDSSYASSWNMRSAVNTIFTILFRGQWNTGFVAAVGTDTTLVARLRSFVLSSWMINSDAEYMIANAARELGRLKTYQGTTIQPGVDSALNEVFAAYEIYGYGDAVWLAAADTASYYGQCADYNICNYGEQIESLALSQTYVCSSTIKIRSQDLTATQHSAACSAMEAEETYFHNQLQTNNVPVADDVNTQLQVNIFNSSNDYGKYAGAIFGIDTNNGGMYLEGDPSVPGNIPNFVAYEASKANSPHYIWNLEHEYVHYLDGRFNLYGNFNAPTEHVVWWAEGTAEYISLQNDNQAAIDTINDGSTYTLGTIFETTYDGFDVDRIYRWGYLAVRFMFERHFSELDLMLDSTRVGDWAAYKSRVNTWAGNYGTEFTAWTQTLTGNPQLDPPVAAANGPYSATENASITMSSSGSYDPDGNIVTYSWDFGDGTGSADPDPSHAYSTQGTYTVTLTVTDNDGLTNSTGTTAVITPVGGGSVLTNGTPVSVSGAQDSETFFTLVVPAGASDLSFTINGGTGDADLYVKFGSAPTQSSYECRPYIGGNNETCDITNVQQGVYHVMLVGYNAYSTTLTGSYTSSGGGNVPDACASQSPQTDGQLENGTAVCVDDYSPMWFYIADVSGHSSVAITAGNGSGDLGIEYSNSGWPDGSNNDGASDAAGNEECIYLTNQSQYWGYLKITGSAVGASVIVDFDTPGCR